MKIWKKWVIYSVSFIVCFFTAILINRACGPEVDPYDYYVSFFHSNIQGEKGYKPFYFTNYLFLYDDKEPDSEADINAAEWAQYLGKGVTNADVDKAMYHLDKRTDLVLRAGYLKSSLKLPDSLAGNTFLKAIANNNAALKYYRFAKEVEKIANVAYDPWDPKPMDTVALRSAGISALRSAETEKDVFIKLRYYYQAQRLLHYGHNYNQAKGIYDKYIAKIDSKSHVKGWALALMAGEERKLGGSVAAAYHFSQVFARYPERRVQAYKNYMYMHVKPTEVLALATNADERCAIYGIDGFGSPLLNMEPLQKVYQYDPASPMLGVLLVREVNKLEESYLTHKLNKNSTPVYNALNWTMSVDTIDAHAVTELQRLKAFCKRVAIEKRSPQANVAYLAAAYLAWMQGFNEEGSNTLKALYDVKLDDKLADQKQIIQLLLTAQNIEVLDKVNEATLLPGLKWLDAKTTAEQKQAKASPGDGNDRPMPFTATERNFYQQILAPAYLKQCDTTMAALALLKTDEMMEFWRNYLQSSHLRTLLGYRLSPPVNPYLHFLTQRLQSTSTSDLYELLGTAYLREHNYPAAMAALRHVNAFSLNRASDYTYTLADPFLELVNDYPKQYRYKQSKGYNKLQFAVAMNTLEQNIVKDPANTASYCYKLGAGLYNTSTYGNAWYLISYGWTCEDFGREKVYDYDDDYIKTLNAEKYFLKAAQLSKTREFRARCIFMAAKCRQKQVTRPTFNITNFEEMDKNYLAQLRTNPYFQDLKRNYKKTEFYKKASQECSYLKDYISTR